MTMQTKSNRAYNLETSIGVTDVTNATRSFNISDIDHLISERYKENPRLANKETIRNMGKNLAKSVYYGLTGFLFVPTAFRRDGKLRYNTKRIVSLVKKYNPLSCNYIYDETSFPEHEDEIKLKESIKIENPICSFFNSLGAYAGILYNATVPAAIGISYLHNGCTAKTAFELSMPLAATAASGAYEILRKWFLYERDKVIAKYAGEKIK